MKTFILDGTERVFRSALDALLVAHEKATPRKRIKIEIKLYRRRRSRSQNALMHMWFGEIAAQTGHSPADVKEALKAELLGYEAYLDVFGRERTRPRPTSSLNRREAMEFMDAIQALAADFGWHLTDPEPEEVRRWREELQADPLAAAEME